MRTIWGLRFVFTMFHVKHCFNITGFQLKIVAIIAMTCNHVANVFGADVIGAPLCFALYAVGGITFPIMAFLVVEGYAHTSNLRKYAMRLALFAALSQAPYYLVFGAKLNVLFTLLLGLGILWLCGRFNAGVGLLATIAGTALLHGIIDWGTDGLIVIYLFGTLREAQRPKAPRGEVSSLGSATAPAHQGMQQRLTAQETVEGHIVQEDVSRETFGPFTSSSEKDTSSLNRMQEIVSRETNSSYEIMPGALIEEPSEDAHSAHRIREEHVSRETSGPLTCGLRKTASSDDAVAKDVSRETKQQRRADLITIIGTMLIPLVVTCMMAVQYRNMYTAGYALVGYTIATALLCGYRGRRGRSMKWLFYAYYPVHLLALWSICMVFK